MSKFDHIEAHVADIQRYCRFLEALFEGGKSEVVSPTGTSMFTAPDGTCIEIKRREVDTAPANSGFCRPCLRRPQPRELLQRLGLEITDEIDAPFGKVLFFDDHERITWHIKDLPE